MNYLFLRGLARNTKHWHGFEKRFDTEVILLDSVGNGEKNTQTSPMNVSYQTDILRNEFLKNRKNQTEWTLVSISLGGMIALDWISRYPNDFSRVFIINTSTSDVLLPWQRFDLKTFLKLPVLIWASPATQEKTILELTINKQEINQQMINKNLNVFKKTSTSNFLRQLISAGLFKSPQKISDNVVFISSENDRLVSSLASKKLALKYQKPSHVHHHAGHDLPLDDPDWLEQIIKSYL